MDVGAGAHAAPHPSAAARVIRDYLTLTKPKVQSLLLFTTVTTMYAAGDPSAQLILLTCLGGALSAGGAGAINHALDRDIDRMMARTAERPVAAGRISPTAAIAFGCLLGLASFALLTLTVNPLAAALSLSGLLGYVLVYTLWLKRSTPQNIVIGGASGAFPPMIGWAAVTGDVSLASISLFLIIFMWTPPHFWALSLYKEGDYAKAGVPMMPVVAGAKSTKLQMLVYTLILCPLTLVPVYLGVAGWVYGAVSIALNLGFVGHAIRVLKSDDLRYAKRMFGFSLLYLFLHFAVLCIDRAPGILPLVQGVLR